METEAVFSGNSFCLTSNFIDKYKEVEPPFGYTDAGGNSLGEITFIRTYSRVKEDGNKERWFEVCQRVIEGMYSVQKNHAKANRLPWNDNKAQKSAQEAYDRMFNLKWTPPGRGLWAFGTEMTMQKRNSAALQNCAMVSTRDIDKNDPGALFGWVMDALMLGVGVGFDTLGKDKNITIHSPEGYLQVYHIEDSREGWVESVRLLINSILKPNQAPVMFVYSKIRGKGAPIKGFGGTASGPEPLIELHENIRKHIGGRVSEVLDARAIVDIINLIGTCVVAGNVRRSATLALGDTADKDFINLKNHEVFPERNSYDPENPGWGWMSNNSLSVNIGEDYSKYIDLIAENGEPGFIWLDVTRGNGRLVDPPDTKDNRVMGFNPCAEQPLESFELCVSGDTYLQYKQGTSKIEDLVGKNIEIWNGKEWTAVTPFYTGENELYRVTLSDGTYLDATPKHEWAVRSSNYFSNDKKLNRKTTDTLKIGDKLPAFSLGEINGISHPFAYEYGWFCGDGYLNGKYPMALVQKKEYAILSSLNGTPYKEQHPNSYAEPFRRVSMKGVVSLEHAQQLRNDDIPEEIFTWNVESISNFIGGWIDTDGSLIAQANTDNYVLYGSENKLRKAILLLRRIGVNHASIRIFSRKGDKTNYGQRNQDLYRLYIPSFECRLIQTRIKVATRFGNNFKVSPNPKHNGIEISKSKIQKIVKIEKLDGLHKTYCFNEPKTGMGVFGNVITHQCTLVEVHVNRHTDLNDFLRTIKYAYLYGKTVTLMPTHWPATNGIMQRNRRIGTSLTGIASFADNYGMPTLRKWMNDGYEKIKYYDNKYSEWLCIRESIRVTTVKPSGTVSLLSGASPGVHWTIGGKFFLRAIRFSNNDPMLYLLKDAGYKIEKDLVSLNTTVVYFPIKSEHKRSEKEVTLFEKIGLAAMAQKYWSDNAVSVTIAFNKEKEKEHIVPALNMYDGQLKTISFLPQGNDVYPQQPYTQITEEEYNSYIGKIQKIDWTPVYHGLIVKNIDGIGEMYCTTDACEIKSQ